MTKDQVVASLRWVQDQLKPPATSQEEEFTQAVLGLSSPNEIPHIDENIERVYHALSIALDVMKDVPDSTIWSSKGEHKAS